MTDTPDLTKFKQKLAERRAREAAREAEKKAELLEHDADLVPDASSDRSEESIELDRIIENIDILEAYERWCGKSKPKVGNGQREGIKISCPIPTHPDKDPSAWINLDKQTWFCGGCQIGGDVYDIAAYRFGYPVPGYKDGALFHQLRQEMAGAYGYVFHRVTGGGTVILPPDDSTPAKEDAGDAGGDRDGAVAEPGGVVVSITENTDGDEDDDEDDELPLPVLEWQDVVVENTFLDEYMLACTVDDVPEEYHFWNALIALGLAAGRDAVLTDIKPVLPNLFVCLTGKTGDGKSRSVSSLSRLLREALPADASNPADKGVQVFNSVASAEALISCFQRPIYDPADPKKIAFYAPTKGLIVYNELSQLIGRAQRQGNPIKPTMMEFYDGDEVVSTVSRTSGLTKADMPFGSALTTTQPKALRTLLGDADNDSGFLNRWVFVGGRSKERIAYGGIKADITPAVGPLKRVQGWIGFGKEVTLDLDAIEMFQNWYTGEFEKLLAGADDTTTPLYTRLDLTMKKLMLLLAINEHSEIVTGEILTRALKIYPYLVGAYAIPAGQLGRSLRRDCMDAIERCMIRLQSKGTKNYVTKRDIYMNLKRKYDVELINRTLEAMVRLEVITVDVAQKGPGRPTERLRYVG